MRSVSGIATLLTVTLGLLFAAPLTAQAQAPDVVVRPSGLTADWKAQAATSGSVAEEVCVFVDGTDYLDEGNHVDCQPVDGSLIAAGTTTIPMGAGNQVYRAVSVIRSGASVVISEPSENTHTVQDLPLPPTVTTP